MTSFYNDVPDQAQETEAQISPEEQTDDTETDEDGATALIPKSVVGDLQPGATVTLKVVKVYSDEVEVQTVEQSTQE